MKHKTLKIATGFLFLILLVLTQVSADDQDFFYEENSNQVTFKYYDLEFIAKAGGSVPKFQFLTETGFEFSEGFSFNVQFKSITEYMDYNEDGAFQNDETGLWKDTTPSGSIYSNVLALSAVDFNFSGFRVDYIDIEGQTEVSAVHFDYTSTSVSVPNYTNFEIMLTVHMYLANQTIDGYEIMGGAEMKFDITMNNWPWQREDSNLALRFDITPTTNTHRINDTNGLLINNYENSTGSEYKVQSQDQVKQQFTIGDEHYQAFFAYANQAKYNISNTYQYRTVNASYSSVGDGTVQTYLSFEHFDEEVVYDPSIGSSIGPTIETAETGTLELVTISAVTVAVVAIIVRRKRQQ